MSDLAAKIARSETYTGPWVIRHPDASPLAPWFVALLPLDLSDQTSPVNPGLVAGGERAADALQFARRADADLYRRAHLSRDIAWVIEPLPQIRPPAWSASEPPQDLLLKGLQELEAEEQGQPLGPVDWWNHPDHRS